MRIGIDYRILAVGPDLITRGMGRYTQQQLREVLAVDDQNEYRLLCTKGTDLSLIAPEIRKAENVSIERYSIPQDLQASQNEPETFLRGAEDYQEWIYAQEIDLYHCATPFIYQFPMLIHFDACPMVATFYDVIPLVFKHQYLEEDARLRQRYLLTLELVKRATRLLAISDAAGQDAVGYLGVEPGRIDRAWPVPEEVFAPLPASLLRKLRISIDERLRLPDRYVLSVTYPHHAKNLETMLRGYAELPASLRTEMPLLLCCHLDAPGRRHLLAMAEEAGVGDDVVLTGVVSDEELCALYNLATMVVHPSRYEGFGLPVVEAMRCGAPVITTTASSLPEVAGDAAILVDAEDPSAFSGAMEHLARDRCAREALRERGFANAARFTGEQLARATLACYRRATALPEVRPPERIHLAVWSPLPPLQSGIADYTAELLDALAPACDIEVFVDDGYLPAEELLGGPHRIQHHRAFGRRCVQDPFDAVVYQVGGSLYHHYLSEALRAQPGIVVLHDLMWSTVLYAGYHAGRGDEEAFRRAFAELEGPRALEELDRLDRTDYPAVSAFLARHPMLRWVLDASPAQIVHILSAAEELRAAYPGSNPRVIPMGVADPYAANPGMTKALARCQAGLTQGDFVIGTYGIVHPSKRLEAAIRALAGLTARHPQAMLMVVGRALDHAYLEHLIGLAARLGVAERVRFTGHVARWELDWHLIAADVVLSLRTPEQQHMSATLMRGIAAGRPAVISDLPEWRFLPAEVCRRVPCDGREVPALLGELTQLCGNPEGRSAMGAAARAFYEREGTIQAMSSRYIEVINQVRPSARCAVPAGVGFAR
jgi:glycosyltransferase involved in cell wall biosynthesis